MPFLQITTNTTVENNLNIATRASALTADILGKPESYIMVKIQDKQPLIFAGNDEPAAHIQLKSLGLAEDKTAEYSSSLCSFIHKELNIDKARIYIEFINPERHMWGWDGRTF